MRSSAFVIAFTAAERRFVALTRSAEASGRALLEFSPEGGPERDDVPLWTLSAPSWVLVSIFDWRSARFVVNATAAASASCLARRNCMVLSRSSDHRR